jgi:NAD(P)-dependent dehydrogenase (short-subunit alcohol dehydrogenase family)
MRLEGKVALIVGAGQSPGEGIGNGRATTLRFAQEGARVLAVDRIIASAEETAAMATKGGGECVPFVADVTKEETLAAAVDRSPTRGYRRTLRCWHR